MAPNTTVPMSLGGRCYAKDQSLEFRALTVKVHWLGNSGCSWSTYLPFPELSTTSQGLHQRKALAQLFVSVRESSRRLFLSNVKDHLLTKTGYDLPSYMTICYSISR